MKIKLPKVKKCDKFDYVVRRAFSRGAIVFGKNPEGIWQGKWRGRHQRNASTSQYGNVLTSICTWANRGRKMRGTIITGASQEKEEWEDQRKIMCRCPSAEEGLWHRRRCIYYSCHWECFHHCSIDAFENRDVATVDLPGSYLHTEVDPNDDIVHMVLGREPAEVIMKVNSSMYQKYVTSDKKGWKLLYVELQKAVYRTLKASLLFC